MRRRGATKRFVFSISYASHAPHKLFIGIVHASDRSHGLQKSPDQSMLDCMAFMWIMETGRSTTSHAARHRFSESLPSVSVRAFQRSSEECRTNRRNRSGDLQCEMQ